MKTLPPPIHSAKKGKWLLGITGNSGFTQTKSGQRGMWDTMGELDELFERYPQVKVYDCETWKHSAKRQADQMKLDGVTHSIHIGYSYGGGYGVNKLSRACIKRGIRPEMLLLCDPVYRNRFLHPFFVSNVFAVRSLFPGSAKIKYPAGVHIKGIRQEKNKPQAHPVQIGDGKPYKLPLAQDKTLIHSEMDDCNEWRALVLHTVSAYVSHFR